MLTNVILILNYLCMQEAPPLSGNLGIGIEKRDWGTRFRGRYFKRKDKETEANRMRRNIKSVFLMKEQNT
jgi:hypothetical protein